MITVRFVTTIGDVVSDGIRRFEYGYWATHVEALMPDGTLLGAHAEGGVRARDHDYDKGKYTREMYVSIPADPEMTDTFHTFLRSQVGKPYDFLAIAGIVAQRDWQEQDSWMCSELQAAALVSCGWFPNKLATELSHITPRDLLLILSSRVKIGDPTSPCMVG